MRLVRLVRARLLRSASTRKSSQSRLESPPVAGIDKEAHPNPLLQTERVQQRREFNVKLIGIDRRQSKGRRGEANDDL